ncbi:hypothetical protein JTE90_012922 [Oedothorax gibbosus]|uniref:Uncharacterized protein n=1 Tax=Oedothorax gibbosus TaxID=931172 RepID=A0AAV6UZ74_9ARAC|nr:hypothetical protein JTE90_012922 [Oedothorax gibbosus]
MNFLRDRPDLLENVTRKGVLKERNEIDLENQCLLNFNTDANFETNNSEENILAESTSESQPQPSEDKENQPIATTTRKKYRRIKERCSNKQPKEECKQKRKYTRAPKLETVTPPLFTLSKYPLEPYKVQLATLKHPDLYPNLIFYQEEDDYPFLRNTSRDVMWSSTLPFQESMEYQELKETYVRLQSEQQKHTRPQFSLSLPQNALFNKVSLTEKIHPRI